MAGTFLCDGQRVDGLAIEGAAEDRARNEVGQDQERAGVLREPRGLGDEHVFLVGAQSGHEGDGDAGERVVDHQRGGGGEVQARREEAAHGLAVDAGCRVEGAMGADEVVAEGELAC